MLNPITKKRKVAIIGAGYTGASIAYALSIKGIADEIVLIDKDSEKAAGEVEDIRHGIPFIDTAEITLGDYFSCRDSSLVIITAGRNRKPGETRMDLYRDNSSIVTGIIRELKKYYDGPVLMVTNPVDILTTMAAGQMGLPNGRVFGTGCLLDTSRLITRIADYVGLKSTAISGYVAGQHGDNQTPVWSQVTVAGMPVGEYCKTAGITWNDTVKNDLQKKAMELGTKIIAGKGRTHYGVATCVCLIADAVLNNRPTVACVSSVFDGEYGLSGIAISVPSIIDEHGVKRRLMEPMTEEEESHLTRSGEALKDALEKFEKGMD